MLSFGGQYRFWGEFVGGAIRISAFLHFALIGFLCGELPAAEVTAARLDGTSVTGELKSWNNAQVIIAGAAGDQTITTEQLVSIRWPNPAGTDKSGSGAPGLAELIDGTLIPIDSLLVSGDKATLQLPAALGANETLHLSVKSLAVVRFVPLDEGLAKQWDEIRQSKPAGDLLVVRKRDGKSLDYVDGVLGEITADKVELKVDGESNRADRAKVAGVFYLRTPQPAAAERRVSLQGRSGLRAAAATVEVAGGKLLVTTTGGKKLEWPLSDLELADFSHGKITYLSDLDSAGSDWTSLVGLPPGIPAFEYYGRVRRDQSAFGSALSLRVTEAADAETQAAVLRTFSKGLAIRSRTDLVFRLPSGFNRFTALAGIEPVTVADGTVKLAVFADDRPLIETAILGSQPAVPIDVQISGAKRLKIVVDYGENLDTGDWLNLCDAKLVK